MIKFLLDVRFKKNEATANLQREILAFPIAVRMEIIKELQQSIGKEKQSSNGKELSVEERLKIVQSLSGIAKIDGIAAPADDEIRENYANYVADKSK